MNQPEIIEKVIRNLITNNIQLQEAEKILIFTDKGEHSKNLFNVALLFSEIAKDISKSVTFICFDSVGGHGIEPPEELWIEAFGDITVGILKKKGFFDKILKKSLPEEKQAGVKKIIKDYSIDTPNVVVALSYYSTSHTQFRHYLTEIFNTRYCSMPLFEESMFYSSLQEDWTLLKKRTIFLKEKLKNSSYITVKSDNGTFLRFSTNNREFLTDTGELSKPGAFSNIPAGEVFVAPREGTANGKLVIEYSPTYKLKKPLTLWIEDGKVINIEGDDDYKNILFKKIKDNPNNRNIAEFGIGTNSKANNFYNILEAEKILGTIHIAIGDNSAFGGKVKANIHEDYILVKPTVEIFTEGKDNFFILMNGKPIF